ncbi:MAG: hypothetical protein HZB26_14855 [Candidatus Hydrogenedentes bacterium]|nr:hypothetical protein [Candidatus Hydrogenedentota bacterium]
MTSPNARVDSKTAREFWIALQKTFVRVPWRFALFMWALSMPAYVLFSVPALAHETWWMQFLFHVLVGVFTVAGFWAAVGRFGLALSWVIPRSAFTKTFHVSPRALAIPLLVRAAVWMFVLGAMASAIGILSQLPVPEPLVIAAHFTLLIPFAYFVAYLTQGLGVFLFRSRLAGVALCIVLTIEFIIWELWQIAPHWK